MSLPPADSPLVPLAGSPRNAVGGGYYRAMSRRTVAWLLTVPLAVAGSQLAHESAYRLVSPTAHIRAHELSASGHAYMAYLPLVVAIGLVLVAAALLAEIRALVATPHGRDTRAGALTFAVLAPAVFVCQEHLERLAHDGVFPVGAALERTFLVGLLLQIPFALIAYVAARLLLGAVRALVSLLSARSRGRRAGSGQGWHPIRRSLPRIRVPAVGYGSRGPPSLPAA